jgi:cell volume regulation protein A
MQPYPLIFGACALVLTAYLLDMIGRKWRVPSVLLLLFFGMALRALADAVGFAVPGIGTILPLLGTLGLVLIVLEGSLDVELSREKVPLVRRAFFAALVLLVLYAAGIGFFFVACFGAGWHSALLNAVPLSMISSAVAISSVRAHPTPIREFVVYESVFSDILGIVLFTALANNAFFDPLLLVTVPLEIVAVLAISAVGCLLLAVMMEKIEHRVKYAPAIALLLLIYSGAKMLHLSPLIFVLLFGLMVNNLSLWTRGPLERLFRHGQMGRELGRFKDLVAEGTFLARALFFIVFGFSVEIALLMDRGPFLSSLAVLAVVLSVRAAYLWLFDGRKLLPLVFVLPRGLITVLLFLSVPVGSAVPGFGASGVMWLVLQSCTLMMLGLMFSPSGGTEPESDGAPPEDGPGHEPTAPFPR